MIFQDEGRFTQYDSSITEKYPFKPFVITVHPIKQCRPRSDSVKRGIWSVYTICIHEILFKMNKKITPDTP